jgi:hypothetical protein
MRPKAEFIFIPLIFSEFLGIGLSELNKNVFQFHIVIKDRKLNMLV